MGFVWMREFVNDEWTDWRKTGFTKIEYARDTYNYIYAQIPVCWVGRQYEFTEKR